MSSGDERLDTLIRLTCSRALSLPPLPSEVDLIDGASDHDAVVAAFAEQFTVDVSEIGRNQRKQLLSVLGDNAFRTVAAIFIADFVPRVWAGLGALGMGRPGNGGTPEWDHETDPVDAHSVAMVALRTPNLVQVQVDPDLLVMGLLVDRRDELGRARTQTINRLHRLLLELFPGGAKQFLSSHHRLFARWSNHRGDRGSSRRLVLGCRHRGAARSVGEVGQERHGQPESHSGQGRRLVRPALHHRPDVLHRRGAADAHGRPRAHPDDRGQGAGEEVARAPFSGRPRGGG